MMVGRGWRQKAAVSKAYKDALEAKREKLQEEAHMLVDSSSMTDDALRQQLAKVSVLQEEVNGWYRLMEKHHEKC